MKDVAQNTKDTSGKILKAAAKLFARYGYDGVSVKAISREAGANSALISYYYGGKPGLYQAVLKQKAESLKSAMVFMAITQYVKDLSLITGAVHGSAQQQAQTMLTLLRTLCST